MRSGRREILPTFFLPIYLSGCGLAPLPHDFHVLAIMRNPDDRKELAVRVTTKRDLMKYPADYELFGLGHATTFCTQGKIDIDQQLAAVGAIYDAKGVVSTDGLLPKDPRSVPNPKPVDETTASGEHIYTVFFDIAWPKPRAFDPGAIPWIQYDLNRNARDVCLQFGTTASVLFLFNIESHSNVLVIPATTISDVLKVEPLQ